MLPVNNFKVYLRIWHYKAWVQLHTVIIVIFLFIVEYKKRIWLYIKILL